MELVAFAIWCFLVALAGGLVGLVLGNIRLPATLLVAPSAASGGGANLLISGASALAAAVAHIRARRINWRLFGWMAPPSVAGAVAGGYLAGVIDENVLLACIAAVLFYSGFDLLRWRPRPAAAVAEAAPARAGFDRVAAVVSGAVIGLLGGLVGLILGSLRMPALLRRVGEPPHTAVGTNLAVGVCVGVAGALGHLPSGAPDWTVAGVGAAASMPGALLGARLTGRLSETQLVRAIGAILLVAATAMVVQIVV
ncbi:MAG TPA: sulfite exporter TauE/SafE family protein [Solirubrobacteraceae bacterium]